LIPAERISRFLSYLLRHRPAEYLLAFDRQGFAAWTDVVEIIQERYDEATAAEIQAVVKDTGKRRFELRDDRVRATYGHSFPVDLGLEQAEPPLELYHGTARDLAQSILRDGLKPRERRYVHLSASLDAAEAVGRRRDPAPAIIVVDTRAAREGGIAFYPSGPLFLCESVPAKFLSLKQP
jgi:putative RNA 2'-phosphotransferase